MTQHAKGFAKADTPSWLWKSGKKPAQSGRLAFTDLEAGELYPLFPDKELLLAGATRGRIIHRRTFIGMIDGKLCSWDVLGKNPPKVVVSEGPKERHLLLNDPLVLARGMVYFKTLKDSEKGCLSLFNPATGKVTVLFDGEVLPTPSNLNGLALSRP